MLTFAAKARLRSRRRADERHAPGRGLAPLSPEPRADDAPVSDEASPPKGWHDSSSDLKRGLHVVEDVPLDSLPPELRAGLARGR